MDPLSLIAMFGPVAVEAFKMLIRKFAPAEFKPTSIDEYEKMARLDLERFKALSEAGGTSLVTYKWADAAVKLMRPGAALIVLLVWAYVAAVDESFTAQQWRDLNSLVAAVMFYLFGDSTLYYAKRAELRAGG